MPEKGEQGRVYNNMSWPPRCVALRRLCHIIWTRLFISPFLMTKHHDFGPCLQKVGYEGKTIDMLITLQGRKEVIVRF